MKATAIAEDRAGAQGRLYLSGAAVVFVACTMRTIFDCVQMSAMDEMSMAGGWTMSMMWMLMPEQSWFEAAASFVRMWIMMMMAMMLPAVLPRLLYYRLAIRRNGSNKSDALTLVVATGYVFVWLLVGMVIFPVGFWLASLSMQYQMLASMVPLITGVVVILAGILQLSSWKKQQLKCCRGGHEHEALTDLSSAWRYGLSLGVSCNYCCAPMTLALLVLGVMNPLAMILVAMAIIAERLAPAAELTANVIGVILVGYSLYLLVQAVA